MRHPMKDTGRFIRVQAFRVVAETPEIARSYGGVVSPASTPPSNVEREEGSALRDSEVLDRADDLLLRGERSVL
jgi:hypothetical protein